MKIKAFFIMIFILLAAQFGAAQEAFVVHEGAESTHRVDLHSGNEYLWEVYKDFNPDVPADPTEFYFTGSANASEINVHWVRAGFYYLKVTESDPNGCTNVKVLAVSVISNNRTIGFSTLKSNACYSASDNNFQLAIEALDNSGNPMDESYYPLQVIFTVDRSSYSQSLANPNQLIHITDDMFRDTPDTDIKVSIEITEATDNQNGGIQPSNRAVHERKIFAQPKIQFENSPSEIVQTTDYTHRVTLSSGNSSNAEYTWSVQPANGTSDDLSLIKVDSANITWDGPLGLYSLKVAVVDGNACWAEPDSQKIQIVKPDDLIISAGQDTTIGNCSPYQLEAWVSDTTGLSYLWSPADNLNDATVLNPIFTPENTSTFVLTVIDKNGVSQQDSVTITVSDVVADAGDDVQIEEEGTAALDGSASLGMNIQYLWTTADGIISSGETTAKPIVSSIGTYHLQVTDFYGCADTSSVKVVNKDNNLPIVDAGNDTIIGNCMPYIFADVYPSESTYTYSWEPQIYLDDATIANPTFTPGVTTRYILTVTTPQGNSASDTVTITVAEIIADAGNDVYMEEGSTVLLDGSASQGEELKYNWTTTTGTIDSGENTANPVISGFGTYYLEVSDAFNCISTDSVNVLKLVQAPIANDDYDTTAYLTEVNIPVLDNDYAPDDSLDPSTLTITVPPFNGTAYVDYDTHTIRYKPNEYFSGTDDFEYEICNTYQKCDQANVYVWVTEHVFTIPNAFTPNGDNINDYFEIIGIENYEGNKLTIYNRWGAKVYEAQNYGISTTPKFWDGIANTNALGKGEVPTGTYYYILNLGNGEREISGSVYIDR